MRVAVAHCTEWKDVVSSEQQHAEVYGTHAQRAQRNGKSENGNSSEPLMPQHGPEESAQLAKQRESAEAVFAALFKAQEAASAAARASGTVSALS